MILKVYLPVNLVKFTIEESVKEKMRNEIRLYIVGTSVANYILFVKPIRVNPPNYR